VTAGPTVASGGRTPSNRPRKSFYAKLKPGPGHSSHEVRADQRARLFAAVIELTAERGYDGLTVRGISRTSGVSTRTFYVHFANVEECFAATYRSIMRWVAEQLAEATATSRDRGAALRTWIQVLVDSAAADPQAARMALIDCYDGGPAMLREIETATAGVERQVAAGPDDFPQTLGLAIVAGVERVLRTKVLEGRAGELPLTEGDLANWVDSVDALEAIPPSDLPSRPPKRRLPPRAGQKDPGFAAFEAIGGDRGRILAAVAKLSLTNGFWALNLPDIRREAGVSRRQLDTLYGGVTDCYLDAIETLTVAAACRAVQAGEAGSTWRDRVERISDRFCTELASSPLLARLGFIDIFATGSAGLRCRERLITRAAESLRREAPRADRKAELAAVASISACWRLVQTELVTTGSSRDAPSFLTRLVLQDQTMSQV